MSKAMETRRELRAMFATLVVLNALMALGAIGLFARMGPAIKEIMQENAYSIESAEGMLVQLTHAPLATTNPEKERLTASFKEHLSRATENITEEPESGIIRTIESNYDAALEGSSDETLKTVEALTQLIEINREKMRSVDGRAQQLGVAGAWSAVLLGALSFLFAMIVFRRMDRRIIAPLEELHEVTEEALNGPGLRRCHTAEAPRELKEIIEHTNRLLDKLPSEFDLRSRAATKRGYDRPWDDEPESANPREDA